MKISEIETKKSELKLKVSQFKLYISEIQLVKLVEKGIGKTKKLIEKYIKNVNIDVKTPNKQMQIKIRKYYKLNKKYLLVDASFKEHKRTTLVF